MISPRPYQSSAAVAVRQSWLRGGRPLVVAPTGAGKTVIAALCIAGATAPVAISHTSTLQEQLQQRLGLGVRSLTIQALDAMGPAAARALLQHTDRCVIDEAHHFVSGGSWHGVLFAALPVGCHVVGFTATPARLDGAGLGGPGGFTDLISTASYSALLTAGWLCPIDVPALPVGSDPVAAYLAHGFAVRSSGGAVVASPWRPGVLFTTTKAGAARAVARLRAAGVRSAVIDADTTPAARRVAFAAFAAGELDVLASPMALSEGFDCPRAEVCILDRACHGVALYLQCAGRVLRPHPGKRAALLLDCRGAAARHGSPTDDRLYSLEGTAIRRVVRSAAPRSARSAAPVSAVVAPVMRVAGGVLRSVWAWLQSA